MWNRIRSVGIIFLDPDLFPFQPKVKLIFKYFVSNIENYGTYDADKKNKTKQNGTAMNKFKNFKLKSRGMVGSGLASKWKDGFGFRLSSK